MADLQLCRDQAGKRVDDRNCERGGGHGGGLGGVFLWSVLARGQRVPRIGERVIGGNLSPGRSYARASEATISRGGFGRSAAFHGSGRS